MSDTTLVLEQDIGRTTLAQEVARVGLPNINAEDVQKHMQTVVEKDCPTYFDHIMNTLVNVSRFLTLRMVAKTLFPQTGVWFQTVFAGILSIVLVATTLRSGNFYSVFGFASGSIASGWIILIVAHWRSRLQYGYIREYAIWETHTISSYLAGGNGIPDRIQKRAETARQIPNAEVKVLAENVDPFLVLERGFLFWKESVVIGAWSTGTPMDDM